jgi:hypothetical protein
MREMTGFTALNSNGWMLEREWASRFAMAVDTGLLVGLGLSDHPRPIRHSPSGRERAVWIVAITALHEAFVHTMLERHRELGAYVDMAAVT